MSIIDVHVHLSRPEHENPLLPFASVNPFIVNDLAAELERLVRETVPLQA